MIQMKLSWMGQVFREMQVSMSRHDRKSYPRPAIQRDSVAQPAEEARHLRNERMLVSACQANDPMALKDMVERFQSDVYRVCCRLMSDPHEAEDLAQEAFIRVFRSLHTWDQERPLKPWILSIAINRCRTSLAIRARRPKPQTFAVEEAVSPDQPSPDELLREIDRVGHGSGALP